MNNRNERESMYFSRSGMKTTNENVFMTRITTYVRNKSSARRCAVSPRKIINNAMYNRRGFIPLLPRHVAHDCTLNKKEKKHL